VGVSEPDAFSCLLAKPLRFICRKGDVRPVDVAGIAVTFICHAATNAAKKRLQVNDCTVILSKANAF
jgi:hypothetical protein